MASSETKFAGTGADNIDVGTIPWNNPGNITADDGTVAATDLITNGEQTHYLLATNFGFAIPTDEVINGIEVEVERRQTDNLTNVKDYQVHILKVGSFNAENKAIDDPRWPNTMTAVTYGGPTDLWGETWTYADINHSTTGFAIAAQCVDQASNVCEVDYIQMTVYYGLTFTAQMVII